MHKDEQGRALIEVDGVYWRGSQFLYSADNRDLDTRGVLGQAKWEQDNFDIAARIIADEYPHPWDGDEPLPEDAEFVIVVVYARRNGIELGSASCATVIVGSEEKHLTKLAKECAGEAIHEAQEALKALLRSEGFPIELRGE